MRAVVYMRVSSEGQVDAWGFDVQDYACRTYAESHGLSVARVVRDEAVSGATPAPARPGLMACLADLRDGRADVLLVARLDRLARDLTVQEAILAEVWSLGAEVHTCDLGEVRRDDPDDPMRTAIRQVMGTFAQLDRALLVKRLRDGRAAKARAGGHAVGQHPFGSGPDADREQAVLQFVRARRAEGDDWQAVARLLNNRPAPDWATRSGRPWTPANLAKVARLAVAR